MNYRCSCCKAIIFNHRPFARCWLNGKALDLHFECITDFLKNMGGA